VERVRTSCLPRRWDIGLGPGVGDYGLDRDLLAGEITDQPLSALCHGTTWKEQALAEILLGAKTGRQLAVAEGLICALALG